MRLHGIFKTVRLPRKFKYRLDWILSQNDLQKMSSAPLPQPTSYKWKIDQIMKKTCDFSCFKKPNESGRHNIMSTPHVKFCRFSGLLCCYLLCAHLISPQNFCTFHRTTHRAETGRPLSGERQSFLLTRDGWLLSECDESIGKESMNHIFQTLRGISLHSRTNQSSREHLLQILSVFLPRLRYTWMSQEFGKWLVNGL